MEDDLPCPELLVGRDGGKLLYLVSRQVLEQLSVLQVPDEAGIFLHCSSAYNIVARALAEFLGQFAVFDGHAAVRSEEHTSELQSRGHLVCRLLLEKKNNTSIEEIHQTIPKQYYIDNY